MNLYYILVSYFFVYFAHKESSCPFSKEQKRIEPRAERFRSVFGSVHSGSTRDHFSSILDDHVTITIRQGAYQHNVMFIGMDSVEALTKELFPNDKCQMTVLSYFDNDESDQAYAGFLYTRNLNETANVVLKGVWDIRWVGNKIVAYEMYADFSFLQAVLNSDRMEQAERKKAKDILNI